MPNALGGAMHKIPYGFLYTFVVAAKHLSFTKAAEELHLTQGAISQQIRGLEERLGFALFVRYHRRLELTEAGARLALHSGQHFTQLEELVAELREGAMDNIVTLSVMPSFATRWLMPRLGSFQQAYPDLQLRIQASDREVDFKRDRIDVAIIHSHLHNRHDYAVPLLKDKVFPVCSPAYLQAHQLTSPQDLARVRLLNDDSEWRFHSPYAEWDAWLAQAGVVGVKPSRGMSFNRGDLAVQAALAGQGVALGRTPLVMDDLRQGHLVRPFDITLDQGNAYLFVCPKPYQEREPVQQLLNWLVDECRNYSPADACPQLL